jgi:hypothetical protein
MPAGVSLAVPFHCFAMFEADCIRRRLVEADMSPASGLRPVTATAVLRCGFGFFAADALVRRRNCAQDVQVHPDQPRGATRKP